MADIEIYKQQKLPALNSEINSLREKFKNLKAKYVEIKNTDQFDGRLPELKQDMQMLIEQGKKKSAVLKLAEKYAPVEFLIAYNPVRLFDDYYLITSPKDAIKCDSFSLNTIAEALMSSTAVDFMQSLVIYTIDRIKVSISDSPEIFKEDVKHVSREILANNKDLTIPEIVLVLRRLTNGFYGKLYDRSNALTICPCFDAYRAERLDAINKQIQASRDSTPMATKLKVISQGVASLPEDSNIKRLLKRNKSQRRGKKYEEPKPSNSEIAEKLKSKLKQISDIIENGGLPPKTLKQYEEAKLKIQDKLIELEN